MSTAMSVTLVLAASAAFAVFSLSANHRLYRPAVTSGGGFAASSAFRQSSLVSQTAIGSTVSSNYTLHHGAWGGPGTSVTAVEEPADVPPRAYDLGEAYPNPFNPSMRIRCELPEAARAQLRIYNLRGQLVRTLLDELRAPGRYELVWDGRDDDGAAVASGTYLLKMHAGGFAAQRKATLVK
jgi:hypothetical protein